MSDDTKWLVRHLRHARFEALEKSKDPSTKVACLIVDDENSTISTGYNGIPRGVTDLPIRMERPQKYKWMQHAEANAVANAARNGVSLRGSTAFVTHYPCPSCAGQLINAGIRRIVVDESQMTEDFLKRYEEDFLISQSMLEESGVVVTKIKLE